MKTEFIVVLVITIAIFDLADAYLNVFNLRLLVSVSSKANRLQVLLCSELFSSLHKAKYFHYLPGMFSIF